MSKSFCFCGIVGLLTLGTMIAAQEKLVTKPTIASELDSSVHWKVISFRWRKQCRKINTPTRRPRENSRECVHSPKK